MYLSANSYEYIPRGKRARSSKTPKPEVQSKLIFKRSKEEDYKNSMEAFSILKKNLTSQVKGSDLPRQLTSRMKEIQEKEMKILNKVNPGFENFQEGLVEEIIASVGKKDSLNLFNWLNQGIEKICKEVVKGETKV